MICPFRGEETEGRWGVWAPGRGEASLRGLLWGVTSSVAPPRLAVAFATSCAVPSASSHQVPGEVPVPCSGPADLQKSPVSASHCAFLTAWLSLEPAVRRADGQSGSAPFHRLWISASLLHTEDVNLRFSAPVGSRWLLGSGLDRHGPQGLS